MLADIGTIIAVYVAFRSIETMLHLGNGGNGAQLHGGSQVAIALCALLCLAIALILGYDILGAGVATDEALSEWP